MEGASKKRKICHHDPEEEEEEDDDEQKIEKFFALIKNIREARFRLMNGSDVMEAVENKKKKKKVEGENKQVEVWKPSFEREDFVEDEAHQLKTVVGSSPRQEGSKKEEDEEELDLGLSL